LCGIMKVFRSESVSNVFCQFLDRVFGHLA
jgi:hypothetical protein